MNEPRSEIEQKKISLTQYLRKKLMLLFSTEKSEILDDHAFNGLELMSGERIFDSPSKAEIVALQSLDHRVHYFRFNVPMLTYNELTEQRIYPFPLKEAPMTKTVTDFPREIFVAMNKTFNALGATENFFCDLVLKPLGVYLANKYSHLDIGIRGTAANISNTQISLKDKVILNPIAILNAGVENGGEYAPMTSLDDLSGSQINHRSVQWLLAHPKGIRKRMLESGNRESARKIFPLLLVYDRTFFPGENMALPPEPAERAKCILEAIVLDMPLPLST